MASTFVKEDVWQPALAAEARPSDAPVCTRNLQTYLAIKRVVDVVGALCGIILCLPLAAIIAIAIKLDSPGPVLFRQRRPGQHRIPFHILKFRTMRQDAEALLPGVLQSNKQADNSLIRLESDPRVTRPGALLRRLSLDEIPQFVNVLRGEMSLIGPRPISCHIPDPRGLARLQARPGLSGLWQVSGRKDTECAFMLEKDMEYLQRRCLWLDCTIMLATFGAVFGRDGAR